MTKSFEAEWGFDNPNSRETFKAPKGQTELVSFRMYLLHYKMIDEIVQSGLDPTLKTRSDFLQDCVAIGLEKYQDEHKDGLSGRSLRRFRLEKARQQREAREDYLESTDLEVEAAKKSRDRQMLVGILNDLEEEREDQEGFSPPDYLEAVDQRINELKRLLD